jgi:hypothetical protein
MNETLKFLYLSQREQESTGQDCDGFKGDLQIITNFAIY